MKVRLVLLGVLAGAAAITFIQLPELRRYLKIRRM